MHIKPLDMKDIAACMALIRDAFSCPPWQEDWSDDKRLQAYAHEALDGENALAFGLYDDEKLVAAALGHVRHWHNRREYIIEDFCVAVAYQSKGCGSLLMQEVKKICRAQNIDEIGLRTRRDAPAYRFYQKQGFAEQENDVYFSLKL